MVFENFDVEDFGLVVVEEAVGLVEAELGSAFEVAMFLSDECVLTKSDAKFAFFGDDLGRLGSFVVFSGKDIPKSLNFLDDYLERHVNNKLIKPENHDPTSFIIEYIS